EHGDQRIGRAEIDADERHETPRSQGPVFLWGRLRRNRGTDGAACRRGLRKVGGHYPHECIGPIHSRLMPITRANIALTESEWIGARPGWGLPWDCLLKCVLMHVGVGEGPCFEQDRRSARNSATSSSTMSLARSVKCGRPNVVFEGHT